MSGRKNKGHDGAILVAADRATVDADMLAQASSARPLEWNTSTVSVLNRCFSALHSLSLSVSTKFVEDLGIVTSCACLNVTASLGGVCEVY